MNSILRRVGQTLKLVARGGAGRMLLIAHARWHVVQHCALK